MWSFKTFAVQNSLQALVHSGWEKSANLWSPLHLSNSVPGLTSIQIEVAVACLNAHLRLYLTKHCTYYFVAGIFLKSQAFRAGEMTQQINELATWQPEFHAGDPHGKRREPAPTSCLLTSTGTLWLPRVHYDCHWYTVTFIRTLWLPRVHLCDCPRYTVTAMGTLWREHASHTHT